MPHKVVLFGKGGIGKSTTTTNLAIVYAQMGMKVLVVGCDPKHDTTVYLTGGRQIPTVLDSAAFMGGHSPSSSIVVKGSFGIDCVEAGGPEPGIGCAGRGITRMSEILKEAGIVDDSKYDVILYDVLGDVVCGGFAAPLRQGFADKVVIVTSEELMSLYAANNIAKAVCNYSSNGISLLGLIANLRDPGCDEGVVSRFAAMIGTQVLQFLPRDPLVRQAEYQKKTVIETHPDSPLVMRIRELAKILIETPATPQRIPNPLSDAEFHGLSREAFRGERLPLSKDSGGAGLASCQGESDGGMADEELVSSWGRRL